MSFKGGMVNYVCIWTDWDVVVLHGAVLFLMAVWCACFAVSRGSGTGQEDQDPTGGQQETC
jgi:hypothetical protein